MPTEGWSEPLVLGLAAAHPSGDPGEAIEDYARKLLADAGQSKFPVDVDLIASVKGIKKRDGEYDFAGRIYVEPNGQLVIDLNKGDNHRRRRFTCAHELMHTAFPDFEEEQRYRLDTTVETNPVNREEEWLCDRGAAALLMPQELVREQYSLGDGLAGMETLAADARVSLEAAGNRLASLSEEPGAFLTFEYGHKPADGAALRRGDPVAKRVRVRYASCAHLDVYIPRFKSAEDESAVAAAHHTGQTERRIETLPGAERAGEFAVEAKAYGPDDRSRVLAIAFPVNED